MSKTAEAAARKLTDKALVEALKNAKRGSYDHVIYEYELSRRNDDLRERGLKTIDL